MTARILAVAFIAIAAMLGAHVAPLLVFAVSVIVVGVHLLPVLAPVGIVGTALFLMGLIAIRVRQTGCGLAPRRTFA